MDALLHFFTNLMIFTGGIICCVFWIIFIVLVSVELYDAVTGSDKQIEEDI